jgi:hypothetical protein
MSAVRITLRNPEETGVTQSEQLLIDRGAQTRGGLFAPPQIPGGDFGAGEGSDERGARRTLRAQVGRLERELSAIVADRFPYISAAPNADATGPAALSAPLEHAGPSLLGLDQLERTRDELAGRLQELRRLAAKRDEHEHRAHELLRLMKLEPGRFKGARLPVSDLGQGGCGVWQVRPRLGLIGMLAGWWQLKLSSGCPLPMGPRSTRGPRSQS